MRNFLLANIIFLLLINKANCQRIGATFVHQIIDLPTFSYGNGAGGFVSFEIAKHIEVGGSFTYTTSKYNYFSNNFLKAGNVFFAGNFVNYSDFKASIGLCVDYAEIGHSAQPVSPKKLGAGVRLNGTAKNIFKSRFNFEFIAHPYKLMTTSFITHVDDKYFNDKPVIFDFQAGFSYNLWKIKQKE